MIAAGDVKKGATLRLDGNLYRVTNATYNKPGRGTATMRLNLMDIRTGNTTMRVFSSEDRLDDVFVETHQVRFLYRDGDTLHFMDNETYDQYEVNTTLLGDDLLYLREELEMELRTYEGAAIDYQLPTTVVYRIEEAENAVAGDSTGNVQKKATLETGKVVSVPLFVNTGDSIKIDTRDGSYLGRA